MPSHLCLEESDDRDVGTYLQKLAEHHEADLDQAGPFKCIACRERATILGAHPLLTKRCIFSTVFPSCTDGNCQRQVAHLRQTEHHNFLRNTLQLLKPPGAPEPTFKMRCSVCGTTKTPRQCTRCMLIVYCSRNCQKKDRDRHRPECITQAVKSGNQMKP